MVEKFRIKLAKLLAKKHIESLENSINQRVAEIILKMDPFEPFFKEFGGVFSKDHPRPESKLDTRDSLLLKSWAYKTHDDPGFIFLCEWLMDKQGQDAIKKGNPTDKTILYSRALISIIMSFQEEVRRLHGIYESELNSRGEEEFDTTVTVE